MKSRALLLIVIAVASALAWWWITAMGTDMYGSMTGASAWMMTPVWDARHVLLLFAMWTVMMVAMMLPSVSPLLFLYGGVARRAAAPGYSPWFVYLVALGYLAVWTVFSGLATVLQRLLTEAIVLDPMMELVSRRASAGLLMVAGVYQMLPMKAACLRNCRAPVTFLTEHARPGAAGAFQLGVRHGVYCVGCCWALMLLLFAGGVMNLWVIGAIAVFVAIEKMAPFADATRWLAAGVLLTAGVFLLFP